MTWISKILFSSSQDVSPQLISVHIPKTAGTSFRMILEAEYGKHKVARLDIPLGGSKIEVNKRLWRDAPEVPSYSVLHGHFSPKLLKERLNIDHDIPMITWLRDPVERVISNYYYLSQRLHEELDEKGKGLNILKKMEKSLLEYAENEISRNRMNKFLDGARVEDFAFVGLVEHFKEDLDRLSNVLNWKETPYVKVNVTKKKKPLVSDDIRAQIATWNRDDIDLYNYVKESRGK